MRSKPRKSILDFIYNFYWYKYIIPIVIFIVIYLVYIPIPKFVSFILKMVSFPYGFI